MCKPPNLIFYFFASGFFFFLHFCCHVYFLLLLLFSHLDFFTILFCMALIFFIFYIVRLAHKFMVYGIGGCEGEALD